MRLNMEIAPANRFKWGIPLLYALALIGMATNWTFDLFAPQFLWRAYNDYLLAMLDGRLDIPAASIGREGSYFNGNAYMYYGLLPVVPRMLLHPFVDLSQTPMAVFSILFFTLVGLSCLQASINNRLLQSSSTLSFDKLAVWWGLTTLSWLGSAAFLISQGGTIYHEPYAASLCLFNIFLALLIRDNFFMTAPSTYSSIPYAVLAAVAIHTRMPMALALYLTLGLIMLVQASRHVSINNTGSIIEFVLRILRDNWLSILILAFGGMSILLINYLKFGNAMSFMGGNYGYFFLEGFTDRRCNIYPKSEYARLLRIIPNAYIYFTGDWQYHWSLTVHLKTGYGRWEFPMIPLALLWFLPIVCFTAALVLLIKHWRTTQSKMLLLGLLLISAGALFQLSYPTITHRYVAELWAPFFVTTIWLAIKYGEKLQSVKWFSLTLTGLLVGLCYQLWLANTDRYYLQDGPIYDHVDYHYSEQDNVFLASLTPEKISHIKTQRRPLKEEACRALAEKSGMLELIEYDKD